MQICRTLGLITALYYLSFLPFFGYQILIYWDLVPVVPSIFRLLRTSRIMGCMSDGIVFFVMNKKFQNGVNKLFFGKKKKNICRPPGPEPSIPKGVGDDRNSCNQKSSVGEVNGSMSKIGSANKTFTSASIRKTIQVEIGQISTKL
ncbi:uncharacterized protein LOC142357139 [Convolutriloba macropyga]|uniref:uncharacterized protein LOC142357139 n=1 Tax=Convolutriloba macropyga TaxID=536237 RepID=UPI003F526AA6